jgi:hypothetical protein
MPKRKSYNWCDFFEHMIKPDEDGRRRSRHVYPIPACKAFPEGGWCYNDGATCCERHYNRIFKLQVEQGLVIPV